MPLAPPTPPTPPRTFYRFWNPNLFGNPKRFLVDFRFFLPFRVSGFARFVVVVVVVVVVVGPAFGEAPAGPAMPSQWFFPSYWSMCP